MRKLRSLRDGQERWSHNGRTYSIVDLCVLPDRPDLKELMDLEMLLEFYKPFNFELAYLPKNKAIIIVGRYKSLEAARDAIKYGQPKEELLDE